LLRERNITSALIDVCNWPILLQKSFLQVVRGVLGF